MIDGDDLYYPTAFQQFHKIHSMIFLTSFFVFESTNLAIFTKLTVRRFGPCFVGPKNPNMDRSKGLNDHSQELGIFTNLTACNVTCRTSTGVGGCFPDGYIYIYFLRTARWEDASGVEKHGWIFVLVLVFFTTLGVPKVVWHCRLSIL